MTSGPEIRVLVVEDDEGKIERITQVVRNVLPDIPVQIDTASAGTLAVRALSLERYDLVILDVNLPRRKGERPRQDGGIEVLRQLQRRRRLNKPTHVIGLSEYPELVSKFSAEFAKETWYLIEYHASSEEWETQLGQKLIHIADAVCPPRDGIFQTDLAILTALHTVELEAVMKLTDDWKTQRFLDDDTAYFEGNFSRDDRALSVVACASSEVGMPAAAVLAMKVIQRYRPKYLAMVGIAAGMVGQAGDILVADQVWDYGSGKAKSAKGLRTGFLPAPSPIPLSPALKSRFQVFLLDKKVMRSIQLDWNEADAPTWPLRAHLGPFASGAAVIQDKAIMDGVLRQNRKLLGIDMEAYAVFVAASQATHPKPQAIVVKSICDFGDKDKNDEHQRYAAFTSAHFLYEFSLSQLA